METLKLLWFFLWRTSLLSLVLGALAGVTYGVAQLVVFVVANIILSGSTGAFSVAAAAAYTIGMGTIFGALGMVGA